MKPCTCSLLYLCLGYFRSQVYLLSFLFLNLFQRPILEPSFPPINVSKSHGNNFYLFLYVYFYLHIFHIMYILEVEIILFMSSRQNTLVQCSSQNLNHLMLLMVKKPKNEIFLREIVKHFFKEIHNILASNYL